MDDDELQQLRARRLAEMQQQQPKSGPGVGGMGGMASGDKEDDEKRTQMEEMRRSMLAQILDNTARERLSRITLVKPEKARSVEDLLIQMARSGQLRQKIGEGELIDLLGQISETQSAAKKITYSRRVTADDSDDDYGL